MWTRATRVGNPILKGDADREPASSRVTGRQFWCCNDPNPCPGRPLPRSCPPTLTLASPGLHSRTPRNDCRDSTTQRSNRQGCRDRADRPGHAAPTPSFPGAQRGQGRMRCPGHLGQRSLHPVLTDSDSQQWRGRLTQLEHKSGKARTLLQPSLLEEGRGQDEAQP